MATFTYDNLNRMLSKLIPDGCPPIQPPGTGCPATAATRDVFYGYDILGRQLTAKFDSQAGADGITNTYDAFGNLTSSAISMAGFSKTVSSLYDLDSNRTRVTHPEIRDPETSKAATVDQWESPMDAGITRYAGWSFDKPWELVPGRWRFEILDNDNKILAAQDFVVTVKK